MSEHDLEKLLGGFAAETLTTEERTALYTAALRDQQVFNALADEQALKELLSDPMVRRKLLDALQRPNAARTDDSFSWLDWFRRPAGLAFAGGVVIALIAVVLGTRIYQESLKQAAQSVATEETKPANSAPSAPSVSQPAPPQLAESKPEAGRDVAPAKESVQNHMPLERQAKRERAAAPRLSQEERATSLTRDKMAQQPEQDKVGKKVEAPAAPIPSPAPAQAPSGPPVAGVTAPAVSARAIFYAGEAARYDGPNVPAEKAARLKSFADAPPAGRLERKAEHFETPGKAASATAPRKPLGLRYSFVMAGTDGQDQEVDIVMASKSPGLVRLTVEANQDSYLQIWVTRLSSTPQLLFPDKKTGKISLKLAAGQRQQIPLPVESEPTTITLRLSRVPFGPIRRQESALLDRPSADQLTESVAPGGPSGSQEEATYVVNREQSPTRELSIQIPVNGH